MRGAYIVVLSLDKDLKVDVGGLGEMVFEKGYYCYVGSANGTSVSIESRTDRHRRLNMKKGGKLHWHIDYLLVNPGVLLLDIMKFIGKEECKISKILEQSAKRTIGGFGSSDCTYGCKGHLHHFRNRADIENVVKKL